MTDPYAAFGGTISSYTWICMVINFLQKREPPILPSLQKMAASSKGNEHPKPTDFTDDPEKLKGFGNANKETPAELLFHFFRHYGYEFEYSKYVVSIREGRPVSRKEKGWDPSNYQDKEARNRLCVEEPFTINRNLGNSADDYAWSGIHQEIRRAFDLLADGAQLETCCEQFVFPPEEKPIFQRPAPKPKPTLTRSASQSGRPNNEPGAGKARKGSTRNQSTQRAGNRRASSGAAFSNYRAPLPFQSPPGGPAMEYFSKGDLHNQLYQQYQYLQAQQDALQRQLQQSAQAQAQQQSRSNEASRSPLSRPYTNGLPSPRFMEHGPPTAPLLPGHLWHYSNRYPLSSPMSQARSPQGSNTNPSSPSMTPSVPMLRRQVHRGSVPEAPPGSMRSQSQPGRSLPNPMPPQHHGRPGYDGSGMLGGQLPNGDPAVPYPHGALGIHMPFSPTSPGYQQPQMPDSALPKEYIGYYVGQSPSLGPQYMPAAPMQMPAMMLRDPPIPRPRRVTSDWGIPMSNGQHASRSPSPLESTWTRAAVEDWQNAQPSVAQSPQQFGTPAAAGPALPPISPNLSGPLIVNGTSTPMKPARAEGMNGVRDPEPALVSAQLSQAEEEMSRLSLRPLDAAFEMQSPPPPAETRTAASPPTLSGLRSRSNSNLNFPSPIDTPQNGSHTPPEPSTTAPLLSPVEELRTPSPIHANAAFDPKSPKANGVGKAAKIANAKQADRFDENTPPVPTSPVLKQHQHERKGSAPNPTMPKLPPPSPLPARSPPPPTPLSPVLANAANASANTNPWQQATRKGHKKSKSAGAAGLKNGFGGGGQPLPASESERKGG